MAQPYHLHKEMKMTASSLKPDVVSQYLLTHGYQPHIETFGKTDYIIGSRIKTPDFELVYRMEDGQLIICDFIACREGGQSNRAVIAFIKLIHQIERAVPQMQLVRGLQPESLQPEINVVRQRLAKALIAQGASWQDIDGGSWLVYPNKYHK